MKCVLAAEPEVLLQFKSVRVILLVFLRVIVSLLALGAYQSDLDSCIISHISGTSHFKLFTVYHKQTVCVPPSPNSVAQSLSAWRFPSATKKDLLAEVELLYHFSVCMSILF